MTVLHLICLLQRGLMAMERGYWEAGGGAGEGEGGCVGEHGWKP